jgi:hypothetical protein
LNFTLAYPSWFIIFCLLLGLLVAIILYAKNAHRFPNRWVFYALAFLRFGLVSVLAFLLLSPIFNYLKTKEEKPSIAFVQDNSASQKFAFRKIDSVVYRQRVQKLLDELRKDYRVKEFSIGETLKDSIRFGYNEQSSDISSPLESIMTTMESENLGAIILASDGIYNKGISPSTTSYPYKGSIYTIGLGDTTTQRDAMVARVFANKLISLGDQFAIRSDVTAFACEGKMLTVNVFHHNTNRMISSQQISVSNVRFSKGIETIIEAKSAGLQHYTISVSKIDGEQNIINNAQDVYVEIADSKEKVLIVANAPHPDIFAMRDALSKNKNFKVEVQMAEKANAKMNDYNLLILHNLPSLKYNMGSLIDEAKRMGVSVWYVVGSQTTLPLLNASQTALQIMAKGASVNDVQGIMNKDFSYFTINANNQVTGLPPLNVPFGDFKIGADAQVLMWQKIGSTSTTFPLWMMQQGASGKTGILAGEGIWRWRLYDFNQHKNHNLVDDYLLKTAQYLSAKHDKEKFRIAISKNVFSESEPISFDAELYNENYELINTPEVNLAITQVKGNSSKSVMNKTDNSYALSIGNLAAGNYRYTATTAFNGKSYSASGSFVVVAQNIEEMNTSADFGMLNQLAKNYDGEFVYANQLESLLEKIKKNNQIKPLLRANVQNDSLINWKSLFALFIAMLTIEWFVRKRTGNY